MIFIGFCLKRGDFLTIPFYTFLMYPFFLFFIVLNLVTFAVFGIDKYLARSRSRRISERRLLTLAWIGGSVGAITAQRIFRHKTQKFRYTLWMILGCHSALLLVAAGISG